MFYFITFKIEIILNHWKKIIRNKISKFFYEWIWNIIANFYGLSKSQFKDIYINNQYVPVLNELGDINIFANNIVDLLKTYSHTTKLKITRRVLKKFRI